RIYSMSVQAASLTFATYSLINGISLAFIFLFYDLGTIFQVFLITAGTFGAMALIGATTKIDLSKFRSILVFGLIGIIIASVVNMFMHSGPFEYIISIAGVLIFAGLTAYDTQKLLEIGANSDPESDGTRKVAIIGALALYLDFINLFLFMLRIFGGGRD
ncbi:MAG: Bax inhibitor-1/YccA family protein, partial [Bacteroidia bacterium]|nr:Bax inhibitor-1/YccA family protein [Bacteroidia bacterium]